MTRTSTDRSQSDPVDIPALGWALTITLVVLYLLCWIAALAVRERGVRLDIGAAVRSGLQPAEPAVGGSAGGLRRHTTGEQEKGIAPKRCVIAAT